MTKPKKISIINIDKNTKDGDKMLTLRKIKTILKQTGVLGNNLKCINMKSIPDWLLFVGNKKFFFLLIISVISCVFIDVNALTQGTIKGTTDPNSYIVTDKATLTINKVSSSDTFNAYKIIDVFYNKTTNVVTYEFTSDFKTFLAQSELYKTLTVSDYYNLTSGDITSGSTQTTSTLDKLVSSYATYMYSYSANGTSMSISGPTASASLDAGVYLVLPTSTQRVYSVMVGNLTPKAENDTWIISNFTINAKVSDASVVKYVGKVGQTVGSYGIGDYVPFILIANLPQLPTNASDKNIYLGEIIKDMFEEPDFSKFIIKDGETTLTTKSDGTVVNSAGTYVAKIFMNENISEIAGGKTIQITLEYDKLKNRKITVEYSLKLSSNVALGSKGNASLAGLSFNTKDIYRPSSGDLPSSIFPAQVTIYTYGIDLLAYKKGDKSTTLSDMTFEVYKDSSLTQKVGTITTGSSGKGTLAGVAEGTYYIKNTKAKSGYSLAPTTSMKVKISGSVASTTDGYYKVEIEVPEAGSLPLTGGSGIIIHIGIGLLLITISTIAFVTYNKKHNCK